MLYFANKTSSIKVAPFTLMFTFSLDQIEHPAIVYQLNANTVIE